MQTQGASLLAANDAYDYEEGTGPAIARSALPSSYDLRDEGVVTPVKRQNPWSTCWGFAAISAAETSILSEMGTTYEEFPLDLSERQLAWFARTPLPEDAGSQAGEGVHATNDDPNQRLNVGGFPFVATSVFSSGVGPISEEQAPYRNNEGLTVTGHDGYTEYSTGGDWSLDESLRFAQPY